MELDKLVNCYTPGKIILIFRPEATEEEIIEAIGEYQAELMVKGADEELRKKTGLDKTYVLAVPVGKEQETIRDLYAKHRECIDYTKMIVWHTAYMIHSHETLPQKFIEAMKERRNMIY